MCSPNTIEQACHAQHVSAGGAHDLAQGDVGLRSRRRLDMSLAASAPSAATAPRAEAGEPVERMAQLLRRKKRHYFIISTSGRPIYSRHGETHEAATIAATIFGLATMAQDSIGVAPWLGLPNFRLLGAQL